MPGNPMAGNPMAGNQMGVMGPAAGNPMMAMPQPEPQTFVFSELPEDEKSKFMDFLLQNNVDFSYDTSDNTYVATIKIVNKGEEQAAEEP